MRDASVRVRCICYVIVLAREDFVDGELRGRKLRCCVVGTIWFCWMMMVRRCTLTALRFTMKQ
jgi:hypothetical protein